VHTAFLHRQIIFVLDQLLQRFQVAQARAQFLVGDVFANVDALVDDRG
jgi:hypothetical protein